MKRDMDLIRLLLLKIENENDINLSKYTEEEIVYHKALLISSKLCSGYIIKDNKGNPRDVHIIKMEWEGHDFLDAAKDKEIWQKVKNKIFTTGGAFTVGIILEMLKSELKKKLCL